MHRSMQQAVAVVGEWEGVMGNNVFKFPENAVTLSLLASPLQCSLVGVL